MIPFWFSGKSTPTPEKDKADKIVEGQSESARERKRSSWWPFGGPKKPEGQEDLTSTPSKIETAEDAENLITEVVVNVTGKEKTETRLKWLSVIQREGTC